MLFQWSDMRNIENYRNLKKKKWKQINKVAPSQLFIYEHMN